MSTTAVNTMQRAMRRMMKRVVGPQPDPIKKWNVVRGDKVEILTGKDAGKQGEVISVIKKKNRLIVEGINMRKYAERASPQEPVVYVMKPGSIHYSNVNLVDPSSGKATRIAHRYMEDGSKVRVAKKTGTIIPTPELAKTRASPRPSSDGPNDTSPEKALEITYAGLV